jgi:uncharacterized protein
MAQLPDSVLQAWEHRTGPAVLTTVDKGSTPNAIYVTCLALHDARTVVVADNYFDKTRRNILAGSKGSLLFITDSNKTFQIKGTFSYHTSGPVFDHMKSWNPKKHPGHAAAALAVEEVFSGAEKLL